MKKRLKIAAIVTLLVVAGLTACVVFDPYIAWFRKVPRARLTIDGIQERGWMHRATKGRGLFVTHGYGQKVESYSVMFTASGSAIVWRCAKWTAPNLPVFPIGDVSPPCWDIVVDDGTTPKSDSPIPKRNLVSGDNFLEFALNDGRRLKATW
jgi:hypothetical protein